MVAVLMYLTAGVCICTHPREVSTRFTRLHARQICGKKSILTNNFQEPNTVCHTYFTVPEDLSTSIIVNFQTSIAEPCEGYVLYDIHRFPPVLDGAGFMKKAHFFQVPGTDEPR